MSGDIGEHDLTNTHHYTHVEIKEMLAKTTDKFSKIGHLPATDQTLVMALIHQLLTQLDELMTAAGKTES